MDLAVGSVANVRFGPSSFSYSCPSEIKDVDPAMDCARIYVVDSPDPLNIEGTDMWVRMSRIHLPLPKTSSQQSFLESPVYHDEEEKREELSPQGERITHPLSDVIIRPSSSEKDKKLLRIRGDDGKPTTKRQPSEEEDFKENSQTKDDEPVNLRNVSEMTNDDIDLIPIRRGGQLASPRSSMKWDEAICTDFEVDGSFIKLKPTNECATCFSLKPVYFDEGGLHIWKVRIDSDSNSDANPNKSTSTNSGSDICVGIGQNRDNATIHDDFSYEVHGWGYYGIGGVIHCNPDGIMSRQRRYGAPYSVHDTISVILDLEEYTLSFGKNDESFGIAFDFKEWTEHHKYPPEKKRPFYLAVMIGRAGSATLVSSSHYGGRS